MYSSSVPWNVLSSNVAVGVLTEGWNLSEIEPSSGAEATSRTFAADVVFASTFSSIPVVQIGLTGFDIDHRDSARIMIKAENITEFGFQAIVTTWADTRVYSAEFNWLAIGP